MLARFVTSGLWKHRDFKRLWAAQGMSALGSQITIIALPLAAILVLDASAFAVALLTALALVPYAVFSIPGGAWVDRVRRRPVMIAADAGRGVILLSIPAAYLAGVMTTWQLYAVAFLHGLLSVAFDLSSQAYLPSLLESSDLVEANAKFEGTRVVAAGAGPGLGGALVSVLSAPLAILTDVVSFVASATLIRSIRHREPPPGGESGRRSIRRELRDGARHIVNDRHLRPLLIGNALANLSLGLIWSIVLVFAVRTLGLGATLVGIVLSLGQIGGFLGAALGRRTANALGVGPVVILSTLLFGPALLLLAAAPNANPLPFLVVGWSIESFARALYGVSAASVRQALVPARLQGRVVGFMSAMGVGAFPLGAVVGGVLAENLGLRAAMVVGAVLSFTPFLPSVLSPLRTLKSLPTAAAATSPDPAAS